MFRISTPVFQKLASNFAAVLLTYLLFATLGTGLASELSKDFKKCTRENNALKRLGCFDSLAEQYDLIAEQNFITPPRKFFTSELTVTPWESEYTLTVEGFVKLIENAVMDDGEKIEIHGWTRQGNDYVLNITMRRPLHLSFLPFETATEEIPFSLLRELVIDGEATDPALFITTIASMVPDEKPDSAN